MGECLVVTGPDGPGGIPVMQIQQTVFKNHKDAYYTKCKMK